MPANRIVKVAAIAALVILPIAGIFIFGRAQWVHKELPYIGEDSPGSNGKTIHHTVGDIVLTDQNGKTFHLKDLDADIIVANIFFATCENVCPEMNNQVQTVAGQFRKFPKVRFVSISIDPITDSVPVLKKYAQRFNADSLKWQMCTGSKSEIYDWVHHDLLLANEQKNADFIHDDKIVLIDRNRHIRAILPTRGNSMTEKYKAYKRIDDDLNNLLYEYRKEKLD
ncbi:MAG: SCO family protein [Bacteroidia bacterium]|nr:SCO family protein [Bacteroidia bacterium]